MQSNLIDVIPVYALEACSWERHRNQARTDVREVEVEAVLLVPVLLPRDYFTYIIHIRIEYNTI